MQKFIHTFLKKKMFFYDPEKKRASFITNIFRGEREEKENKGLQNEAAISGIHVLVQLEKCRSF